MYSVHRSMLEIMTKNKTLRFGHRTVLHSQAKSTVKSTHLALAGKSISPC